MTRYRLSRLAEVDLARILRASDASWGAEGRQRYRAAVAAALRKAAAEPFGAASRDRAELGQGVRSLHLRHARAEAAGARVARPVHVVFYRAAGPGLIEIVRVLHERMDPAWHLPAWHSRDAADET